MFKCTLPMLRLTTTLSLLGLPIVLTKLLCFHQRQRPPSSILTPTTDAIILSCFPLVWFFGFLYYTEVPSLLFVVGMVVAASQEKHWIAGLVRECYVSYPYGPGGDRTSARSYQLHVPAKQYNMGALRICIKPAHVFEIQTCRSRQEASSQDARPSRSRGWARYTVFRNLQYQVPKLTMNGS